MSSGDASRIFRWCARNEHLGAQAISAFLEALRVLVTDMLCTREKHGRLSRAALMGLVALADKGTQYLKVNTNGKQIFGLLAVDALPDGSRGNTID